MDFLAITSLIGGAVQAADPYFYTAQEQAKDGNIKAGIEAQNGATAAQLAAIQAREKTTQTIVTYGLAGVLGVSALFLASRLVGE